MGEEADVNAQSNLRSRPYLLRNRGITWRELDGEIVALDLQSSTYLKVKGAGAVVWPLLAAGTNLEAMVEAVLEVYNVEPDIARSELEAFLDKLSERKLLR